MPRVAGRRRAPSRVSEVGRIAEPRELSAQLEGPGLVYLQALDATSAERGCGARGRGLRAWLYVVSVLVHSRVYTHPHIHAHAHAYTRLSALSPTYPITCPTSRLPLCLYRYAVGSRTGEYTVLPYIHDETGVVDPSHLLPLSVYLPGLPVL